jgi:hypothetical protein
LGAPTSFASAAISSEARLSPYRLIEFGGTFGASCDDLAHRTRHHILCNLGMPVLNRMPCARSTISARRRNTSDDEMNDLTHRPTITHHIRRHNPEPHIKQKRNLIPPSH